MPPGTLAGVLSASGVARLAPGQALSINCLFVGANSHQTGPLVTQVT